MTRPKDPTLTHELLAKALGVTVTTVKSYRRKFPEFWRPEGVSKPLRFPPESLDLCRRIHQHFKRGLSVEETRKRLGDEFRAVAPQPAGAPTGQTGQTGQAASQAPAPDALARMENLLEGLFTLQNRTHSLMAELVAKLDTLADRLDGAPHSETSAVPASRPPADRAAPQPLRATPDRAAPPAAPSAKNAPETGIRPPQALLDMPVVVRSDTGEFLGVTLKSGGPVTLARFETFLADRARGMGQVRSQWLRQGQEWTLRIEHNSQTSDHHFVQAVTPRGNTVARFASLSVGGKPATEHVLQAFLRQVKETLDA
ncbi:hypothetical protein [Fundidesulfovibrio terrae]|uniref:hypothetical protein n=1 Tax=Fundidesulfovibrio terrae TaxID=2922866 RepID=UPI001FAF94FE|nr:hypothetical protein [Fundidesulfovibrio terrae]